MDAANMIEGEKYRYWTSITANASKPILSKESGQRCDLSERPCRTQGAGGDVVIIASYALLDFEEAKAFKPWVIFPDTKTNKLIR